ncbi:MAG: hypothetical protein RSA87_03170 [Malacoplasma sp.]
MFNLHSHNTNRLQGVKPLLALTNDSFWRGIFGPFFAFCFPIIFIAILGTMIGYDSILGGSLGISAMAISLTSMPQAIFEFKKSSLLKRIGATPVKPYMFLLVTGCFYFVIMFLSVIWCIIFSLLIFGIPYWNEGKVISSTFPLQGGGFSSLLALPFKDVLANVDWLGLIWGQLMAILIGASCGMFLVSISKSTVMLQAIGVTILIISQFLSAQVLPPAMVRDIDGLWYASYILSPFKSSTTMIFESWNGELIANATAQQLAIPVFGEDGTTILHYVPNLFKTNIFNVEQGYWYYNTNGTGSLEILSIAEKYVIFFIPFLWMFIFGSISYWKFRWTSR